MFRRWEQEMDFPTRRACAEALGLSVWQVQRLRRGAMPTLPVEKLMAALVELKDTRLKLKPTYTRKLLKIDWGQLEVGDSIPIVGRSFSSAHYSAIRWAENRGLHRKWIARRYPPDDLPGRKAYRLWRLE